MSNKPTRCPTCHRRHKRSTQANARYWLLLHALADGMKVRGELFSAETWHLYLKSKFLGAVDHKLPSGKTLTIVNSTADLDVAQFSDYLDKVQAWASEHDIWLEDRESAT